MNSAEIQSYVHARRHEVASRGNYANSWISHGDSRAQLMRSHVSVPAGRSYRIEKAQTIRNFRMLVDNLDKVAPKHTAVADNIYVRDDRVRLVFESLRDAWRGETMFVSANSDIVLNENYQKIIGLGPLAIPWILDDLKITSAPWFWALRMITREDPVDSEDRGVIDKMTAAWINWAKEKNVE